MTQIARCDWLPERARWSHLARSGLPAVSLIACSRLSVSEDDRKSERATSGISGERDPGPLLFPHQTLLIARPLFQSFALTESLEQAISLKKNLPESHIINPLLTKFVRSRWLDIGLVLFLQVYGP